MDTVRKTWVPVTDEIVGALSIIYCDWIADLTEIRKRIDALRAACLGTSAFEPFVYPKWQPSPNTNRMLDDLNDRDEWFAAHDMRTARIILTGAETELAASRARFESIEKRVAELARLYANGWRPFGDDPWSSSAGIKLYLWCGGRKPELLKRLRWSHSHADEIELWVAYFEDHKPRTRQPDINLNLGLKLLGRKGRR